MEDLGGQHVGRDGGIEGGSLFRQQVEGIGVSCVRRSLILGSAYKGGNDHGNSHGGYGAQHEGCQNDSQNRYELFSFCIHSHVSFLNRPREGGGSYLLYQI